MLNEVRIFDCLKNVKNYKKALIFVRRSFTKRHATQTVTLINSFFLQQGFTRVLSFSKN